MIYPRCTSVNFLNWTSTVLSAYSRELAAIPQVPEVKDVMILGDCKENEKVIVRSNVVNGSEESSTVQFFLSASKNFELGTNLQSITSCMINKEFLIPIEASGHYLVVKYTPMNEDAESGESRYASTEKHVEDAAPSKPIKLRGKNKNKKLASLKPRQKLEIKFYNNRAVGEYHSAWSRHLEKIVRDKNICPIRVKTWKELSDFNKQHMWDAVKECFFNQNIEFYREQTLEHMRSLWVAWWSSLNKDYVKPFKSKAEVLKNVPVGMNDKDWKWLVINYFLTGQFQKASILNSNNRIIRVDGLMPHRTGSKPHRQLIYEMGGNKSTPPDIAKIFLETRQKKGSLWSKLHKKIYATLSQIQVVEKCFGPQRHSHVFGFGGGMKRKYFHDSQAACIKELQQQLRDKEEENNNLKQRMDGIESRFTQIENDNSPTSCAPPTCANDIEQVMTSKEN